ncbi:MAG: anaerobic sulfatase maturase [Verrucomicrobia bacterium]|nr:anaerobic sulfatase maturase [Verrucomicrobiota bacterium]
MNDASTPRPFQLLIKPASADCNARCGYCFYLRVGRDMYTERRHRMPDAVLERVVASFMKLRLPISVFSWQGGEPTLMGLPFYERVVELQKRHGARGQVVGNALQTNGLTLDARWARFLAEYRFLVGLSLDGPRDVHEQYRGRSHHKVMRAARLLREHNVPFSVLCCVSKANAARGADMYRWFVEQGFDSLQFLPIVETDPATGALADYAVTGEEYGRFMCDVFDEWSKDGWGLVSVRLFEAMLAFAVGAQVQYCPLGERCDSYLVIEHNGDVYPCDFFVRPELKLGNIMEKDLPDFFNVERAKAFAAAKTSYADECAACEYLQMCYGGCQKDRLDGARSSLCDGYRMFFAHTTAQFAELAKRIRVQHAMGER